MNTKRTCYEDIREISDYLEKEHQNIEARILEKIVRKLLDVPNFISEAEKDKYETLEE